MTHEVVIPQTAPSRRMLYQSLLLLMLLFAAASLPRLLSAQSAGTEWRACTDAAWSDYNRCLMDADGFFHRLTCDVAFQADYVFCSAKYAGQVRDAFNGT